MYHFLTESKSDCLVQMFTEGRGVRWRSSFLQMPASMGNCYYCSFVKYVSPLRTSLIKYFLQSSEAEENCGFTKWADPCGRTAQNNRPLKALVFHQTLSTPKASYIGRIPSSTPQGRTRIIHVFPPRSNSENEFTILSLFHTTRVLRNTLLQYLVQSVEFKQRNYNKHLR